LRLLYAFPEPLPLPRARGVQVAHAVASLVAAGIDVDLAYVPVAGQSPLAPAGILKIDGLDLVPLSRGWPFPLDRIPPFARWHSVRFFARRLRREIAQRRPDALYVRHLKLAALLLAEPGLPPLIYEAHEVFADTAKPQRRERTLTMERAVVASAAAVANSRATAERLTALYGAAPPGRPTALHRWPHCRKALVAAATSSIPALLRLEGRRRSGRRRRASWFRLTLIGSEPERSPACAADTSGARSQFSRLPRPGHGPSPPPASPSCPIAPIRTVPSPRRSSCSSTWPPAAPS
jgi:hypothetical protein